MRVGVLTLASLLWLVNGVTRAADTPEPARLPADPAPVEDLAQAPAPAEPAIADPAITDLIDQLGDIDPKVREAASKRLAEIGKPAVAELQKHKDAENPEIRARVRSLIRQAARRLPPAAPPRHGLGRRQSVSISMVNGQRSVDVDDNGYRIKIRQGPDGIVMDVTGVEHDREITETYKAKDAEELKKENPEAYALYDKYNQGSSGAFSIQLGGGGGAGRDAAVQQKMLDLQLAAMERMLGQLDQHPNIPPEHRARIQEQIDRLRARHDDVHQKLLEDMEKRREKALDHLKAPLREDPKEEPKEEPKDEKERAPAK